MVQRLRIPYYQPKQRQGVPDSGPIDYGQLQRDFFEIESAVNGIFTGGIGLPDALIFLTAGVDTPVNVASGNTSFTMVPMANATITDTNTFSWSTATPELLKVRKPGLYIGSAAARFQPNPTGAVLAQYMWHSRIRDSSSVETGHFVQELWQPRQRIESFVLINTPLTSGSGVFLDVIQNSGTSNSIDQATLRMSGPF